MAKFISSVDFNQNLLLNPILQRSEADITDPVEGQFYYNSVSKSPKYFDGTSWVDWKTTSLPAATTNLSGILRLALDADAIIGTEVDTAITPHSLSEVLLARLGQHSLSPESYYGIAPLGVDGKIPSDFISDPIPSDDLTVASLVVTENCVLSNNGFIVGGGEDHVTFFQVNRDASFTQGLIVDNGLTVSTGNLVVEDGAVYANHKARDGSGLDDGTYSMSEESVLASITIKDGVIISIEVTPATSTKQIHTGVAVTGTGTGISATVLGSKEGDYYKNTTTSFWYIATAPNTWDYKGSDKGIQGEKGDPLEFSDYLQEAATNSSEYLVIFKDVGGTPTPRLMTFQDLKDLLATI